MAHQLSINCSLFFILLLVITISARVEGQRKEMVGTRTKIKDVKTNKEVQNLGRYSVEEHNRIILQHIAPTPSPTYGGQQILGTVAVVFVEVVEAEKQVVNGIKYYLKVEAMQDGVQKNFDAEVVVKPWAHSKQLLTFGPSPN